MNQPLPHILQKTAAESVQVSDKTFAEADEQLMQEYRSRLGKLDETLKALEERLKASSQQTVPPQTVDEAAAANNGVDVSELRELLNLAKDIKDEVSRLVARRTSLVK
ncbi:MAG: hypothetical protein QXQ70_08045 [Candidatus Caldarchaeum sp.]